MIIKFIPKWHNVQVGEKVLTSGLDGIFFANIPVGVVTKVEVQSSYTVAHIKTYSDIFHPKTFFLINDAKATLNEGFDSTKTTVINYKKIQPTTQQENNVTITVTSTDLNKTMPMVSSIPSRIDQTQEVMIEPETIEEHPIVAKPKVKKRKRKPKRNSSTLDLF
jgi:rod shape-determining protein MreC